MLPVHLDSRRLVPLLVFSLYSFLHACKARSRDSMKVSRHHFLGDLDDTLFPKRDSDRNIKISEEDYDPNAREEKIQVDYEHVKFYEKISPFQMLSTLHF